VSLVYANSGSSSSQARFSSTLTGSDSAPAEEGFSDDQLRSMAAPNNIGTLRWSLLNPEERRQLLRQRSNEEKELSQSDDDAPQAEQGGNHTSPSLRLRDLDQQSGHSLGYQSTSTDTKAEEPITNRSSSDITPRVAGKSSDPAGDAIINKINEQRRDAAQEMNDKRAAAAGSGKAYEKVKPDFLTADEQIDTRDIYARLKAEGMSDEGAFQTTLHLMKPKNDEIRSELRENNEIGAAAEVKPNESLAEVVTGYELSKINLNSLSKGFGDAITALKKLDTPAADAAVMALEGGKAIVDAIAAEDNGKTEALGAAEAFRIIAKQTGQTYSQVMEKMGKGDLKAFGAVMTDVGTTYKTFIKGNDNLQAFADSTLLAGHTTLALGIKNGDKAMIASGKIMVGGANFMGHWDFKDDKGNAATTLTRTADGMTFMGVTASAIGELTGSKDLTEIGSYVIHGAKLIGPINTLDKLLDNDKLSSDAFVNGSLGGAVKLTTGALDLSALIVDDEETKEALQQSSSMLTSSFALYKGITASNPNANDIATAGIQVVMGILDIAGVDIPPKMQELINAGLSGLAAGNAEGLGAGAAAEFLTPYIVDLAQSMGIELTEQGVTEALGTAGTYLGYAAAVYKIVMVGFDIAKIAENDQLSDIQKATKSIYALSDTLLAIGLSQVTNPVGWAVLAVSGELNIHGSLFDMTQNGLTRGNVTRLHFGALADWFFPARDPHVKISTFSPVGFEPPAAHERSEEGFFTEFGNKSGHLWSHTPFGVVRVSIHEFDIKESARRDMIEEYRPLFKQIKTTDENLANAFNLADEKNGEAGRSMALFTSTLENDNRIKVDDNVEDGVDAHEMVDYRYGEIANRVADSGKGSKAGIAFNAWIDGINNKVIDESGDTFSSADIIAKVPALLTMSPDVIERLMNTVEPGTLKHVLTQLTSTVGTYLNALSNPLIQDPAMNEHQTLDFVFEKLGLTEDYRFAVAPETEGIPQRVKDFVSHLNEMGGHGTVQLMGQGVQMGKDPQKNYQLIVNGELDAYRFVDGDTPHFMKMSRAVVDLSGDFGDWPPEGVVDWTPLAADKNANPLHNGTELVRQGDLQWVKPFEALTEDEIKGLEKAEALTAGFQAKGKDVKLLGVSKLDGHFEVLVEGKQHAYKLEDDGDRFVQVTQRNLQTDIPGNVQKFHANLNRVREKEGKETVQFVSRSEDGKTYQLKVDGELDTYRYVEDIEIETDYSTGVAVNKTVDKSYYEKVSSIEVTADWPPQHAVNWSDPEFLAGREGNLVQWVKPEATLSGDEQKGLELAKNLEREHQMKGQDVKVLGVSKYEDHFELLVEGKQHAYTLVEDKESGGFKFVQATQTKLFAKASPEAAAPEAPETTLPLADANAAFMDGKYQEVIDFVNQNPSSGADQQILDTYKQAAEHGLELEQAIAKGDYGEIASVLKLMSGDLHLAAPDLAEYYATGATLASEADIIIDAVVAGNYTLANTMAKAFLEDMGKHPEFTEKFHQAVDLARFVVDVSNLAGAGSLTEAAKQADDYAQMLPPGELQTAFSNIANNLRNEKSGGILIVAANTALMDGNYQEIINYAQTTEGPNSKTDQQVIDTYKDAANIGLKIESAMQQEDYATAAKLFGFMADRLQPLSPEIAGDYKVAQKLALNASAIVSSMRSGDYANAIAAAESFLKIGVDNPVLAEKFGPAVTALFKAPTTLANKVVEISGHYNAGNYAEAAQLATAYAKTLPPGELRTAFSNIAAGNFESIEVADPALAASGI